MVNNTKDQLLLPRFSPSSSHPQDFESLAYRFIQPDEYESLGINSDDVPMGTFAAMDHPPFLPSRVGGNAYGFGFIEKSYLNDEDIKFLERIREDDPRVLSKHAKKINEIYKKLGLLIRVSYRGFRYYLIPINLITHSLQDVKCKADEIERVIIKHVFKKNKERLEVGILTFDNDLIVHELIGRMPTTKFTTFNSLEKISKYPGRFDLIVLPKNMYEFLFNLIPELSRAETTRKEQLFRYARYLSGKIYDLLETGGELYTIANCLWPQHDQTVEVRFTNELELKNFLLFTHLFKTESHTRSDNNAIKLRLRDLYWYLNGAYVYDETLEQLLGDRSPLSLSLEEIENLPYLDIEINETILFQNEEAWDNIVLPFFTCVTRKRILPDYLKDYLNKNLLSNIDLPGTISTFLGEKKNPPTSITTLKKETELSGLAGCKLELVARYRNTFSYLLDVLDIVEQIIAGNFDKVSEVQSYRLRNLFESKITSSRFRAVEELLRRKGEIKVLASQFNPENLEGHDTPVLENLEKMSLLNFEKELLEEILLVVLGHTTLGRITLGKLPEKSLSQVTSKVKEWGLIETINILRLSLLMSVGEIAASLGSRLTRGQIRELFSIYEDVIEKITESGLDWDKYERERTRKSGGIFKRGIREILKLFNLFDYLDSWNEIVLKGPFERQVFCSFDTQKEREIKKLIKLVQVSKTLEEKYSSVMQDGSGGFLRKVIHTEFHGTGHLFPNLDPESGLKLLWLAVNTAQGKIVNFNPLIKNTGDEDQRELISNYQRILSSIRIEELNREFFRDIQEKLRAEQGFAFILGTGFQVKYNPKTAALDVSHVDINKNLELLKSILQKYRSQQISSIPLDQLKKLENLFMSIYEYSLYAKERDLSIRQDVAATAEFFLSKEAEIIVVLDRLKEMLRKQMLVPGQIYDSFTLLLEHCPGMLGYIVPELRNMGDNHGGKGKVASKRFVLRCFRKIQALANEDKELFQDQKIFHQLAQQEFGPFTAENVAANQFQIDKLTAMVNDLKKSAYTLEVLALSFLLTKPQPENLTRICANFNIPARESKTLELLYRCSGLLHGIIYGEEPLEKLETITRQQSHKLLKAFFIREIIYIASLREGNLTEDLLDCCFGYYTLARRVLEGAYSWHEVESKLAENKSRNQMVSRGAQGTSQEESNIFSTTLPESSNENLLDKKVMVSAIERILRLAGLIWVDFADISLANSGVPVTFIYRKKALQSLGMKRFKRELQAAQRICYILENENEKVKNYLLTRLAPLNNPISLLSFRGISDYLSLENWLKLLLLAIKVSDELYRKTGDNCFRNIDFRLLSRHLEKRYEILNESLNGLSFPWIMESCDAQFVSETGINGIFFFKNSAENCLDINFKDPIGIDEIVSQMESIEDLDELKNFYHEKISYLKTLHFYTKDYQQVLDNHFHKKLQEQTGKVVEAGIREMVLSQDFQTLLKQFQKLKNTGIKCGFSDTQFKKLNYAFERRLKELQEETLDYFRKAVKNIESEKRLKKLWTNTKASFKKDDLFYTGELKLKIARIFDNRLKEIHSKHLPVD